MREDIVDIREKLDRGEFVNEAAVSSGIVLRILSALSWPTFETSVVAPEFSLSGRRVDFALCHPPKKPAVFIEVKQVGGGIDAELQLFEYAFHTGVPMAVLTTGREWHFYLPGEQGTYNERRVYGLDLLERDPDESVERLQSYLDYHAVCSGQAIERARQDYRSNARKREIDSTLPEAWNRLVADKDEILLELLADKVEAICGFKPEPETVAKFLGSAFRLGTIPQPGDLSRGQATPRRDPPSSKSTTVSSTGQIGYEIDGRWYAARSGRTVMVGVLEQLQKRDANFLERFAARPENSMRRRRYVAESRQELFHGNPKMAAKGQVLEVL